MFLFATESIERCVGVAKGTVFQETRLGAGFKTSDFVEEKLGALPLNDSALEFRL